MHDRLNSLFAFTLLFYFVNVYITKIHKKNEVIS